MIISGEDKITKWTCTWCYLSNFRSKVSKMYSLDQMGSEKYHDNPIPGDPPSREPTTSSEVYNCISTLQVRVLQANWAYWKHEGKIDEANVKNVSAGEFI